jgi:hypothetical protein
LLAASTNFLVHGAGDISDADDAADASTINALVKSINALQIKGMHSLRPLGEGSSSDTTGS